MLAASILRARASGVRQAKPRFRAKFRSRGKSKPTSRAGNIGGDDKTLHPWWDRASLNVTLACRKPAFAPPKHHCPDNCRFLAPDPVQGCHWQCVPEELCGAEGAQSSVADPDLEVCRQCDVTRCLKCVPGEDRCMHCMVGYDLVDGTCHSHVDSALRVLLVSVGLVLISVVIWYVGLLLRPVVNKEILEIALEHRNRCKQRDEGEGHKFYSMKTDLRSIPQDDQPPIGGPGLMLLFNFQFNVLLWALVTCSAWLMLGAVLGPELFRLGTYNLQDDLETCRAVHWGQAMRERLRLGKLAFTAGLYVVSTLGVVAFAAAQRRRFIKADAQASTMMDYALWLSGLPQEGGALVEAELQAFIEEATGRRPVGVSVCWDFSEVQGEVYHFAIAEVRRREALLEEKEDTLPSVAVGTLASAALREQRFSASLCPRRLGCACAPLCTMVDSLLALAWGGVCFSTDDEPADAEVDRAAVEALLAGIVSSGQAVVVFPSELDRNEALRALDGSQTPLYKGTYAITVQHGDYDPEDIVWENINVTTSELMRNIAIGVALTLLAILVWADAYYLLASYEATNYAPIGDLPGWLFDVSFAVVVVMGNQIMYLICSAISDRVGFFSRDTAQAAYVVLYTAAVITNTVVDIFILVYTTYLFTISQKVRTDDGILMNDLPDSASVAISYPMMKFFGRKLYQYNFPSCFLSPFIGEAVFTTIVPYHLGIKIVGSRYVCRQDAEACMQPMQMDLCRYGDIVVNVILATMSLFTTSGWVVWTLGGFLLGSVFIYVFDHYRVLREVETCYFARDRVDLATQRLLVIPCGILAAAVTFQLHGLGSLGLQRHNVWLCLGLTFAVHTVLHIVALWHVVPWLARIEKPESRTPYSDAATHTPANWFTVNPVHCLRSQYIHEHDPPCIFYVKGKEAVAEKNPDIGLFYHQADWAKSDLTLSRACGTFRSGWLSGPSQALPRLRGWSRFRRSAALTR